MLMELSTLEVSQKGYARCGAGNYAVVYLFMK
jgi:hypothetical protein